MAITASDLRKNVYKLLDGVLESGVPLVIERKGRRLRVVPADQLGNLERLVPHPGAIVGDPEELVHLDWYEEWGAGRDLD